MSKHTEVIEKLNVSPVKAPLTVESPFASCNLEKQELFAVRPGIPVADALNEASCILYNVRAELCEAGMQQQAVISPTQAWLLHMAVESAKAVIDSVYESLEKFA
ncbi:DUF3077 domain-containing protein [Pseudomonas sp. COR58]|uniref:DUF3077 domain-containing protein n=1 Tax=Pseudomonas ekonensis TaxID=2842353 RepID=A0ABS6PFE7_9PSED|nr:DUF3077 domain-containing protein [Pseudomonas ekonensis]MBV4459200.1 DUF3077 domain-containing protein [Pseudomonas ekonensis]